MNDLTWLTDWVKRAQRKLEDVVLRIGQPHDLRHRLHHAQCRREGHLATLCQRQDAHAGASPSNGAVAGLARDRILTTVTQVRPVSDQWAYTIQPWVLTYLTDRPDLLAG